MSSLGLQKAPASGSPGAFYYKGNSTSSLHWTCITRSLLHLPPALLPAALTPNLGKHTPDHPMQLCIGRCGEDHTEQRWGRTVLTTHRGCRAGCSGLKALTALGAGWGNTSYLPERNVGGIKKAACRLTHRGTSSSTATLKAFALSGTFC